MQSIYKLFKGFILGCFLFFVSSCNRDKNNDPVDVDVVLQSSSEPILNGNLTTQELYVFLKKIEILGIREVGENVNFTRAFDRNKKFNLLNYSVEYLNLPEGVYSSLLFKLNFINNPEDNDLIDEINDWLEDYSEGSDDLISLKEDLGEIIIQYINSSQNALCFKGQFTFNNKVKYVVFVLNNEEVFGLFAKNTLDNQKLSLSKDLPMRAKIIFNPSYWFENISATILNNAYTGLVENQEYILINKYINSDLYTSIFNRLEESTSFFVETK